jgi:hypothetical protein
MTKSRVSFCHKNTSLGQVYDMQYLLQFLSILDFKKNGSFLS